MKYKYDFKKGITKARTKLAIAVSSLALIGGGVGLSLTLFGTAHAISPSLWEINAPEAITFVCGGGDYNHTLNTVSEDSSGSFSGTGTYNPDNTYTWNINGNVSGNNLTFTIVYTGTNAGYTLDGIGTIAPDGSITGTVDNNCQTFSMPAGTATPFCYPVTTSKGLLTAAQIGGDVTGDLNASGCDIGVYYNGSDTGNVSGASIHDANKYGVFVDGISGNLSVKVTNSHVYNVGNHTSGVYSPNGVQTGIDIYYYGLNTSGKVSADINHDLVDNYQKGGIVINGQNAKGKVDKNTVNGAGPVDYIAQNGIQIGFGATGEITSNKVTGNAYTGTNFASSGGILLFGGLGDPLVTNVKVKDNKLVNNDVGIFMVNYNAGGTGPATTPTKDMAVDNWISDSTVTNVSGLCNNDPSCGGGFIGYQAGINDVGNKDFACNNNISGTGYADQGNYNYIPTPPVFTQTGPNRAVVRHIDAGDTFPTTDFSTCHNDHFFNEHYNNQFFKFYHNRFGHWYFH
ncbi:MAG TPA: hypothetical protein VEH48_02860 [Candidatus Nitrosopolaris sp.]|nr:hypothetical protein [Candidatus Nitrosopolaris sp.]